MSWKSFFSKKEKEDLDQGLEKTKKSFFSKIASSVAGKSKIDDEVLDDLEEILVSSDVSVSTTLKIIDRIEARVQRDKYVGASELNNLLKQEIAGLLEENSVKDQDGFSVPALDSPYVIMVVGVNGVGKTTTIGKLAHKFKDKGLKVVLGASDTFRAAAVDQLKIWAERINVNFISNYNSSDPASIAYDGTNSGIKNNHDHIIIDTAGRLHTSANLMHELEKIYRIVSRLTTQITVLMSIDANIGQNSIKQVEEFNKYLPIDSIIINKMDGTAKGGIVLSILQSLKIPISFLGVGESYSDIIPFNLDNYLNSMVKGN